MLGLFRQEPLWSSPAAAVLHSICYEAAESADVATCVELLRQLLLCMQQVALPAIPYYPLLPLQVEW